MTDDQTSARTLREAIEALADRYSIRLAGDVDGYVGGVSDTYALAATELRAILAEYPDDQPEGETVTEWRMGHPEGPSYAIAPNHPEAERWTRRLVAAQQDGSWVESRTITTYPIHVTPWTPVTPAGGEG